jgi:hypothetical protein
MNPDERIPGIRIFVYRADGTPVGHRRLTPFAQRIFCEIGEGYGRLETSGLPIPSGGHLEIEAA